MRNARQKVWLRLVLAVLVVTVSARATEVVVDCNTKVVRSTEPLKYGVCLNYLIDSDRYDPKRKRKIRESLKALNVKAIRWNEGEIGDKMIWSIPPFERPDAHVTHQCTTTGAWMKTAR